MVEGSSTQDPYVSVIIPVYNDPNGVRRCLEGLKEQTLSQSRFEVLVVDNGSTDETRSVIEEFPYELLIEDQISGSYAARNKGIRNANGEILAFTDADCTPEPEWLEAAVTVFQEEDVDLVSGRVKFEFTSDRTPAERFDALVNMRNDKSVREGAAKTANLFARRAVIDEIGLFPDHLQSGGDVFWTKSATGAGFKLVYAPEATVSHPTRQLYEIMQKMYRIGKGNIPLWRLNGLIVPIVLLTGAVRFPLKVLHFLTDAEESSEEPEFETPSDRDVRMTKGVYLIAVLSRIVLNLGRIKGLIDQPTSR